MPLFAPALTVEEEDGSPTTAGVKKLQFPNGSVTNDGGGTVSVAAASGSVATDAIYDAKGDLPVGTGANTAAKLTVGANGCAGSE